MPLVSTPGIGRCSGHASLKISRAIIPAMDYGAAPARSRASWKKPTRHSARHSTDCRISSLMEMTAGPRRSEEHTSELQSLMRISYAVFCLKKKKKKNDSTINNHIYKNRQKP